MDRMNARYIVLSLGLLIGIGELFPVVVTADEGYIPAYTATPSGNVTVPTPNPTPSQSSSLGTGFCTIKITQGNNTLAPADVEFAVKSVVNGKAVTQYSFDFGDGSQVLDTNQATHHYNQAGIYQVTAQPIVDGVTITKPVCLIKTTLKAAPLIPSRIECTGLRLIGNTAWTADKLAQVRVTGYSTKDEISSYRLTADNLAWEQNTGDFEVAIATPGAYALKAYVKSPDGTYVGGNTSCTKQINVKAAGITHQPETGPSSIYWISLASLFFIWLGAESWFRHQHPQIG